MISTRHSYVYDEETQLYYLQSRYYNPTMGRFINADGQLNNQDGPLGLNQFAYCLNNPVNMSDPTGHWAEWFETAFKVIAIALTVAAVTTAVVAVSAFTAGTCGAGAVYGASIFLGAALSGINGGVANEANGNSFFNGYIGGASGGAIQASVSKSAGGTILGGGLGVAVGTAFTDLLNNLDPYSSNSSAREVVSNAFSSGSKALVTSALTAGVGYASKMAIADGAGGLMPTYTFGFGEAVKAFFGWVDDALVYIWE